MAIRTWEPATSTHTVTYEGAVLGTYERNMHDDSDFMAVVWDEPTGQVIAVLYATTRGWTYNDGAQVDATPQVQAKAQEWAAGVAAEILRGDAATVTVGADVRSLVTRGKAKGLTGRVERIMNSKHDSAWAARYAPTKVAKVVNAESGASAWVEVGRLEVTTEPDEAELQRCAQALAKARGAVSVFRTRSFALCS